MSGDRSHEESILVTLMILAFGAFAIAQIQAPTSDVLGAHLNYGRGCAACHAPHSGARGNGNATTDTTTGDDILWGQDVQPLFGKTIITGGTDRGNYPETFAGNFDGTRPDTENIMTCLSCHDGNWATGAMMKNKVYETVPCHLWQLNPFRPCLAAMATPRRRLPERSPGGT